MWTKHQWMWSWSMCSWRLWRFGCRFQMPMWWWLWGTLEQFVCLKKFISRACPPNFFLILSPWNNKVYNSHDYHKFQTISSKIHSYFRVKLWPYMNRVNINRVNDNLLICNSREKFVTKILMIVQGIRVKMEAFVLISLQTIR